VAAWNTEVVGLVAEAGRALLNNTLTPAVSLNTKEVMENLRNYLNFGIILIKYGMKFLTLLITAILALFSMCQ